MTLAPRDDLALPPGEQVFGAERVPPAEHLSLGRMVETNGGSSLESVPGFDSIRARNRGLLPVTVAPCAASVGSDGFVLENVIGSVDSRVEVGDTTALPWRSIAMLSITYEDYSRGTGTAWFLSEGALGTAGHNIRHPEHGRATEILVSPAFNGRTAPFGTYRVQQTYCDPRWLGGSNDPAFDFGVLMLADPNAGRSLGWFGFAAYKDGQLDRLLLNVCGYATDKPVLTQYYNGGRLEGVDRAFLRYTFDTEGGMSGSPIFARFGEQRVVVGIHTSGDRRVNRARRIDAELYAVLKRYSGG